MYKNARETEIYKGNAGNTIECVTGRLFFYSDLYSDLYSSTSDLDTPFHHPVILVGNEKDILSVSDTLNNNFHTQDIIGAVIVGSTKNTVVSLTIPLLTIDYLPKRHNGKIAILDPEKACLFVDPDLDAIERYSHAFESNAQSISCFCEPISYTAFSHSTKTPIGALHVCSAGKGGEIRSEDELFDDYRDLCESVRPLPLTLMLCPAYPFDDDSRERFFTHAKAIFRAAVYGKIQILCGGPCALNVKSANECFYALSKAKEELYKSGHERNTEISVGLYISSPFMLCSIYSTYSTYSMEETEALQKFDFFCLDLEKLPRLFFGIPMRDPLKKAVLEEFFLLLKKAKTIFCDKTMDNRNISATANLKTAKCLSEIENLNEILTDIFIRNT